MNKTHRGALVIVSGLPGSGKTSIARPLSMALGVPYIAKDVIKESLGETLGAADIEASMKLGMASTRVMLAIARESPYAVLDNHWYPEFNHELVALERPLLEVFCQCPGEVALDRIRTRASTSRHAVHRDSERLARLSEDFTLGEASPLALGPFITVDTTKPVDIEEAAVWVRRQSEWK